MSAQPGMVEIRQSIVACAQMVVRVIEMADVSQYDDLSSGDYPQVVLCCHGILVPVGVKHRCG